MVRVSLFAGVVGSRCAQNRFMRALERQPDAVGQRADVQVPLREGDFDARFLEPLRDFRMQIVNHAQAMIRFGK